MLRFVLKPCAEHGWIVGLGLSDENIRRLQGDQPIRVHLGALGVPGDIEVLVFAGKDEATMERDLSVLIGPGTKRGPLGQ
jgi:hypothetical protein